MLKDCIQQLMEHQDLTVEECQAAIDEIIEEGNAPQAAAFLVLLRSKPETPTELLGIVHAMRQHMLSLDVDDDVLDDQNHTHVDLDIDV